MDGACSNRVMIIALCAAALLTVEAASAAEGFTADQQLSFYAADSGCRGTIGECLLASSGTGWDDVEDGSEEETVGTAESEIMRRMLAASGRYISYGALRRNSVPCSRRGASYYNCRPGAQANPYSRGCSRITRCRR